jgi:vacuolar-type H+-ATPase subunit H
MKDILKRLLEAEQKAQDLVKEAKYQRDIVINEARKEVKRAEERFVARIPEIYSSFENKARERASEVINEIHRRNEERCTKIESEAAKRHDKAVDAVLKQLFQLDGES